MGIRCRYFRTASTLVGFQSMHMYSEIDSLPHIKSILTYEQKGTGVKTNGN